MKRQYKTVQHNTTQYHIRLDTTIYTKTKQGKTVRDKIRHGNTVIQNKPRQDNTSQHNRIQDQRT